MNLNRGATHLTAGPGMSGQTVLQITSTTNTLSGYDAVENIAVDCNGVAAIGLQLMSSYYTTLRNVASVECTIAGFDFNTINGAGQPIDARLANATKVADAYNLYFATVRSAAAQFGIGMRFVANVVHHFCPNTNPVVGSHGNEP